MIQQWYAVYTRPRWEKKVAELLTKRKVDNYCPVNKVVKQWHDRKKLVHEPLFTSYVFVRANSEEISRIRQVDGVVNFVYWLGKPAVIKNTEIEAIKDFLADHQNVRLEKVQVNVNDMVRIVSGALRDHQGQVIAVQNRAVKVVLPSLGYVMCAEIQTSNIEVITRAEVRPIASDGLQYSYSYTL